MEQWIPFRDGEYRVERAFLVGQNDVAAPVEQAVVEVYTGHDGMRQLKGNGMVKNVLVVELLEESDELDLILDLGNDYRYRMIGPSLIAGKVFDPEVKSLLQFAPTSPWIEISPEAFNTLTARVTMLA
ncbi:MAG: hypothetical protein JEZ11_00825 [Desulfobacterales bacterium]|nr:hypothetical protein [Desulfobacterales bacterium]